MIMCAEVREINSEQMLLFDSSAQQEVVVNTRCGCHFKTGDRVKIIYNGIMTMSIPPQISADRIIKMSDSYAETYLIRYNDILNEMISGMCSAELSDSISYNFIVQMIPHHEAAIKMSENILQYTENAELTSIARGIIDEQTKGVENMREVLSICSKLVNSVCDVRKYQNNFNCITHIMFRAMRNACSDQCVNCDFIREMIPHHEGAVKMSKNALQFNICPELTPILNDIIVSQERGINQMRCLARRLKCK